MHYKKNSFEAQVRNFQYIVIKAPVIVLPGPARKYAIDLAG